MTNGVPKKISLDEDKAPTEARVALCSLSEILNGLSIEKIREYIDVIEKHCGKDAIFIIIDDEYWGPKYALEWYRMETAEEVVKRVEANHKRQKSRELKRREDAAKRLIKDKKELARLQALYPDGVVK